MLFTRDIAMYGNEHLLRNLVTSNARKSNGHREKPSKRNSFPGIAFDREYLTARGRLATVLLCHESL